MTEQPPSAEAMRIADALHLLSGNREDGARMIDILCEQRVSAETERCVQIALQYRDEVDAGEHAGLGDPERALGQGYAANLIGKRIRSAAERPATAAAPDHAEQAEGLLLEWMRSRPGGTYQSSIQATEFKRLIDIIATALSAVASQHQTAQAAEVEQAYRVGKTFGTVETRAAILARLQGPDEALVDAVARALDGNEVMDVPDGTRGPHIGFPEAEKFVLRAHARAALTKIARC
jgi:hypothetical protein